MTASVTPIGRAPECEAHTGPTLSSRLDSLIAAVRAQGYLEGERDGYRKGLYAGALTFAVIGLALGALVRHGLGPLT